MAKLTLQITGNISDVESKIKIIQNELSALEKKPIKIGVQASGLDAIAEKLKEISAENVKAAEAAAKLANAEARKLNAQAKAAAETRKSADAQKAHAQASIADAEATQKAAISNEKLTESMKLSAKQADYAKQRGQELYNQYLQLAQAVNEAAHGALTFYQSTSLVIRNVGLAEAQVRNLASAYRELGVAVSGVNGGNGGGGAAGYFQPNTGVPQTGLTTTGGREVVWSRYGDFRDNVIEGQWRPVVEGTDAVADSATRANSAFNTLGQGVSAAWAKMKEGTPIANALGDSIGNIIVKITTWQVVNGIVANIKRAFTDALDTMKAVDQELINIQKVSDLTNADIQRIGESAYDVASKYGVAADEYLKAVYTFQKAGLGSSAEQMAELATKTMLVGDTTADVATQFLISANAAWKFGGSVEALSQVVDEADKLNNTYAVTLQDIAEGLPIVGATAAQVGLSAEQTMAAISTIVASTGQSATKAATALRAIIMNLIGETGELDDGTKVTEESIKSLNTVLNEYARESLAAAEAEGKILDPMEAIAALAKAAEDGFLNQAELFDVLSGLGGKLRTTQLTALVNNMEMYNSMLHDTAEAAGTADSEISKMLESWNSRTQILTNNFTKLISHLISSDGIKAGIDVLNQLVVLLDSGIGKTAMLAAAFLAVGKTLAMIGKSNIFNFIVNEIGMIVTGANAASVAVADLWALMSTSPLFWAVAAAALFTGINAAVDALTTSYTEQKAILDEIQSNYDQMYGVGSEYDNLKNKVDALTDAEKERLAILELEVQAEKEKLAAQKEATFLQWRAKRENEGTTTTMSPTQGSQYAFKIVTTDANADDVTAVSSALSELIDLYETGNYTAEGFKKKLQELALVLKDSAEAIQLGKDAGVELTESEQNLLNTYNLIIGILKTMTGDINADTDAKEKNTSATNEAAAANETLQKAFDEVEKKSSLTYGTLAELEALYPGLSARILDANGNLTAEGKAALSTKAAFIDLLAQITVFNNTGLDVSGKIASLQALAQMAGVAGTAVAMAVGTKDFKAASDAYVEIGYSRDEADNMVVADYYNYSWKSAVEKAIKDKEYLTESGGGGGGGGGSKAKTEEELLAEEQQAEINRLKEIVALRKQELSFLQESGASEQAQIDKMREVQAALHDQAEYLRSIEADEKDILALSTEWWSIENKINDATEKIAKKLREDVADALTDVSDTLQGMEDAAVKPLQDQLDALEASRDASKERREEEEKIAAVQEKQLALEKARIALENAQRERTVRQYNAVTGKWEWVANAKTLEAAQQNLENAQKNLIDAQTALAEYYTEKAYESAKNALEKQIKATKEAFSAFRDSIKEAAQAVKDGEMSFDEAYDYIAASMKGIYDEYGIDLTNVLLDAIGGMDEVTEAIVMLLQKVLALANSEFGNKDNNKGNNSNKNEKAIAAYANIYNAARERGDADTMAAANRAANETRGIGSVITAVADVALISAQNSGKSIADYSADYMAARAAGDYSAMEVANRAANILRGDGNVVTAGTDIENVRTNGGYDYGGILTGIGGIKATREDEMVLPPDTTRKLLTAEQSGAFDALLGHLNIVTAAANEYAGFGGATSRSNIGTQYNGGIININGIELRNVTESTTLGELTRMAKNLALAKGS